MTLILATGAISAAAQKVPSVVVSSTATVNTSGTTNVGKVVQDSCGNLYELESGGNLMEIPAGGGAAKNLANYGGSGADGLSGGIAIDKDNNLYVDHKWSGDLMEIPSTNCVPNASAAVSVAGSALGSVDGYWYDPGDIAVDSAGHIFVVSNGFGGSGNIYEQTSSTSGGKVFGGGSMGQISSIAVDASGDVFFTASGSGTVYEVPANSYGTTSATAVISSGLTNAMGVAFDSAGNLYVGDAGTGSIYEVPVAAGGSSTTPTLQFRSMYLLAAGMPLGSPLSLGVDGKSFLFGNNDANVYEQTLGEGSLGEVAAGSTAIATMDVAFNSSVSPSSFSLFPSSGQYSMSGGSTACMAGTTYTAGQSCSEKISFTPTYPGSAEAGVTVSGADGSTLATLYFSGEGMGSGITVDPGMLAATGSGLSSPKEVALDPAGDVFYADPGSNAVMEFAPGSSTATSIGSGLSQPSGVAVDGAGNVLIADTGNNRIVEVPMINGVLDNSKQMAFPATVDGEALNAPSGLALDSAGDLYIADTGNNRIVAVPYHGGWNFAAATTVASSLNSPLAVVADSSGDLYVADSGAGQIYKILAPLTNPSQELVAVGFGNPSGLAVDASGSLFVADPANGELERIPKISGSLNPNMAVNVGTGINAPYGVAVDPAGNLYVSDSMDGKAYKVSRTSTTLLFGHWAVNSTSGSISASVENEGNMPLNLSSPWYAASGNSADFNVSTSASTSCASGAQVAMGDSCSLSATFTPSATGQQSMVLALASDAVNASPVQVTLSGAGGTATSTTTALAITAPSNGTPFFGQPITLSASVSASSGTPGGTVTLLVDGVQDGVATVNSSGAATFQLASGLTGGSHTALAVYNGASTFSGSVSPLLKISVSKAPTVTALTVDAPYNNPLSAVSGSSVTFTAMIQSSGVGIPTGMVTFTSNGKSVGTAPVQPASGGAFSATLTTAALPAGSDGIVATYSGDANYIQSSSKSATVTVVSSAQVTLTPDSTSIITSTSGSGTISFMPTSYGGWSGLIGFSCVASSLPANAHCVFSPGQTQISASTPGNPLSNLPVKMSIAVNQPPQTPTASGFLWWFAGPMGLLLFFVRRRYAGRLAATLAIAGVIALGALAATGLSACGSSAHSLTPAGTSTVTVVAYVDPFTAQPSSSTSTPTTQACPDNDPTKAPCAEQTFKVSVTVK